jgi:hypothetical protein
MSINDATPEMWNKLRTKYKALAEEEYLETENDEWLKDDSSLQHWFRRVYRGYQG